MIIKNNKCLWCDQKLSDHYYKKCYHHSYDIIFEIEEMVCEDVLMTIWIINEDIEYKFNFSLNKIQYTKKINNKFHDLVNLTDFDESYFKMSFEELLDELKILTLFR